MNISKAEQRVLHELALGGEIRYERNENGKVKTVNCYTRDGYINLACDLSIFSSLRRKKYIKSKNSAPYQITKLGLRVVNSQMNQR